MDAALEKINPSISRTLIWLASLRNRNIAPLFWKAKWIRHVCNSSKDAKMLACRESNGHGVMVKRIWEKLLFNNKKELKIKCLKVSVPLLQSIGSNKRISHKLVIPIIEQLKECLKYNEVESYAYIDSKNNLANMFWRRIYEKKKAEVVVELVEHLFGNEIRVTKNILKVKT